MTYYFENPQHLHKVQDILQELKMQDITSEQSLNILIQNLLPKEFSYLSFEKIKQNKIYFTKINNNFPYLTRTDQEKILNILRTIPQLKNIKQMHWSNKPQ